ncbi:MAG: DsrE family protein [Cyclobacteriaceae bacterium]
MKTIFTIAFLSLFALGYGQNIVNPIIKGYGGVYELPYADEKIDPTLVYNIVVDVGKASDQPEDLNRSLDNVARLLNLHAMAGVPNDKMHVAVVLHGGAAFTVKNNEEYRKQYSIDNPNIELYKELIDAGVEIVVCGQTVVVRKIVENKMVSGIKVASSMLTSMTTYQLKGYAVLIF